MVVTTTRSFEIYELDEPTKLRHLLFRRKSPWEPLKVTHRLKAAVKHVIKRKKE